MLEDIMGWNWNTIFLGVIIILSFVNILALNHIVAWQTMNQHQRSLTHKKIEEMVYRIDEISNDIEDIKSNTGDIKDNTEPPLPPITQL
jgi:hypothetical protein